jgi:hypothetical protein
MPDSRVQGMPAAAVRTEKSPNEGKTVNIKRLLQKSPGVIPAEAGIQFSQSFLDPGLRRGDGIWEFCKRLIKLHSENHFPADHRKLLFLQRLITKGMVTH